MGDLYRDEHGGTKGGKQRQTTEMPHGRQAHALTSMLHYQLWHLPHKWQLFLQPPARGAGGGGGCWSTLNEDNRAAAEHHDDTRRPKPEEPGETSPFGPTTADGSWKKRHFPLML